MNTIEQTIYDCLVKDYGPVWEAVEDSLIKEKLLVSKKLFTIASKAFVSNASAYNYNVLITAMIVLQYWQQKRVKTFTVEAEF